MRIGIDASAWYNGRGFGRFTRELVTALVGLETRHAFVLLFDRDLPDGLNAESVVVRQGKLVTEAAVAGGSRSARDLLRFTAAAHRARLDVLFYPAVYSWFPCPPRLPNLVTFHDAIAERFPGLVFPQARARAMWSLKVKLASLQATRFLTVSHAAKQEIVAQLGLDPSLIDVATEGPKAVFKPLPGGAVAAGARAEICAHYGMPPQARYFAYVGGFAPHKNVIALVQAFAALKASYGDDIQLLLVGDLASHGFHSNIDDIRRSIAGSIALVLPSFSEGFGLPAVEAMASGTPVLASREGSLPEVVGDAGLLFDPRAIGEITACMRRLLDEGDLARDLAEKAIRRAREFSWTRGAHLALAAIERCLPPVGRCVAK
jgi:glycosyltransferase involved in cell wall biosynthesis